MKRRIFFLAPLAFFLPSIWSHPTYFKVIFSVNLRQMGFTKQEFNTLRSKFENDAAIDEMSYQFERSGLLIGRAFEESSDELKWVYTFRDAASFNRWEQNLYVQGMVKKNNRPYNIAREYCVG